MSILNPHPDRIAKGFYWDRPWPLAVQTRRASNPDFRTRPLRFREDLIELPLKIHQPQIRNIRTDLFHEAVPEPFIDHVLDVICGCPQHLFLASTKYPENLEQKLYGYHPEAPCRELGGGDYLKNLCLGITAENQEELELAWKYFRHIPASVRFLNFDPLLGRVDLTKGIYGPNPGPMNCFGHTDGFGYEANIQWVIAGGRSRPLHPDWVRSLRDQCQAAGVPFWFTGWGDFCPELLMAAPDLFWDQPGKKEWGALDDEGNYFSTATPWNGNQGEDSDLKEYSVYRVGRKAAGRILDGRTWEEMPDWK